MWSLWSKIERYSECAPGVADVDALRIGVPPSYVVPSAPAGDIAVFPVVLMLTTWPLGSNAKSFGAEMEEPLVAHVEVSSSAMNASLYCWFRNSGYSSERKRKLKLTQLAPFGTLRSILRMLTSKSVSPRTLPPPSSAPEFGERFAVFARFTSPVVMIPNVEPFVGNELKLVLATPLGLPLGGIATNEAPVTIPGAAAIALATCKAPSLVPGTASTPVAASVRGGADCMSRRGDGCALPGGPGVRGVGPCFVAPGDTVGPLGAAEVTGAQLVDALET